VVGLGDPKRSLRCSGVHRIAYGAAPFSSHHERCPQRAG
jgi:hypothetical protein